LFNQAYNGLDGGDHVIFSESFPCVKILSVLELSWEADKKYAKPRPFHALSYRIVGNATFTHDNIAVQVNKGDIAYVPAGFDYEIDSQDEHLFVVHFSIYDYTTDKMEVFTPTNTHIFKRLFQSMYTTWNSKQIGYQYATTSLFYRVMEQIHKQHTERCLLSSSEKMKFVIDYIHEHFTDRDLSVSLLAEMAGMSDTYFRKLFVKHFSVTPLKYINNLRISYAEELLCSGYYSIESIAEKTGFSDPKYFSTVIKKVKGCPPSKLYK